MSRPDEDMTGSEKNSSSHVLKGIMLKGLTTLRTEGRLPPPPLLKCIKILGYTTDFSARLSSRSQNWMFQGKLALNSRSLLSILLWKFFSSSNSKFLEIQVWFHGSYFPTFIWCHFQFQTFAGNGSIQSQRANVIKAQFLLEHGYYEYCLCTSSKLYF